MKKLTAIIAGLAIFFAACNSKSGSSDTTVTDTLKANTTDNSQNMPSDTNNGNSNSKTGNSNEFASKAAIGGMTEVELGKLAQSNSKNKDIIDYGKMLEKDHSDANDKLRSIAASENISLPTAMDEEHSMHVSDMRAKSGNDFDKAFIAMMLDDHEKDIAEFKTAASSNPNEKIKDFAAKTLPTLQKHLDRAKAIKGKM